MLVRGKWRRVLWAAILATAWVAGGCAVARVNRTMNQFVPPGGPLAPLLPPPESLVQPVRDLRLELASAPKLVVLDPVPASVGWLGVLLRESDWHFQLGKRAHDQGDFERARREFDRALDILLAPRADSDEAAENRIQRKIEELADAIYRYDLEALPSIEDDRQQEGFERAPLDEIPQLTFPIDPAFKNQIHEELRATCSQLPLEAPDPVVAYIRYFSSGRGRQILVNGLRRAGRYRPMIQRILDEEGLPQELVHVAQAESGFFPRAISRRRATGMWQFIKSRGQQYGLQQTPYTDDRLDPEKATRAAARHLRDLYQQFGDWYLALAAYNAGPLTVERAIERTGYADFWELRQRNVLPKETANYVPIILAMIIMAKNPAVHGLEDVRPDPPLEYDSLEMTSPTNLLLVADLLALPVGELRELNPALLKDVAPTGYVLRVPKGAGQQLASLLEGIPAERRQAVRAHRAAEGDTLASIARRYRVPESSLTALNGDLQDGLQPGDLILVPAPVTTANKAVAHSRAGAHSASRARTVSRSTRATSRPSGASRASVVRTARLASGPRSRQTTRR
ncbi:MAG: transglycosylase SLT domain-containing protein [Bryobacteraceae bacterium]